MGLRGRARIASKTRLSKIQQICPYNVYETFPQASAPMLTHSSFKLIACILLLFVATATHAQNLDASWRLRIEDLKHHLKAEATIQFTDQVAEESCMGGQWKRVIVKAKTGSDPNFFPLTEPLAYRLERGALTLGRTEVCDGYLFLSTKSKGASIRGTYDAVSIGYSKKLGYFSMELDSR